MLQSDTFYNSVEGLLHAWFYYSGFADVYDADYFIQHMNGCFVYFVSL